MYRVITAFCDLTDDLHAYAPGDTFPRAGLEVSAERLAYLASDKTRLGVPVIEETKAGKENKVRRAARCSRRSYGT